MELEAVSNRLIKLNNGLQTSLNALSSRNNLSADEEAHQQVSLECARIAEEFQDTLKGIMVSSEHKAWKSCSQTFKGMLQKNGLELMQRRLGHQREQLVVHLLVVIR